MTTPATPTAQLAAATHDHTADTAHTDAVGTADAEDTGVAEVIAAGRARIDELDGQIVALVQQRLEVSRAIQRARLAAGGRRVEHSREVDIVNRYAAALGRPGADVALALLTLARGASIPVERSA